MGVGVVLFYLPCFGMWGEHALFQLLWEPLLAMDCLYDLALLLG